MLTLPLMSMHPTVVKLLQRQEELALELRKIRIPKKHPRGVRFTSMPQTRLTGLLSAGIIIEDAHYPQTYTIAQDDPQADLDMMDLDNWSRQYREKLIRGATEVVWKGALGRVERGQLQL